MSMKQTEKLMQAIVDELNEPEILLLIALGQERLAAILKDKPFLIKHVYQATQEIGIIAKHLRRAIEI